MDVRCKYASYDRQWLKRELAEISRRKLQLEKLAIKLGRDIGRQSAVSDTEKMEHYQLVCDRDEALRLLQRISAVETLFNVGVVRF